MRHSLEAAVADGTLTEREAHGIEVKHVALLALRHPEAEVLVQLRDMEGDGRCVMSAKMLAKCALRGGIGPNDARFSFNSRRWEYTAVRNVAAYVIEDD